MPQMKRQAIVDRLAAMVRERKPIIGGGAGTGLSAKCEEMGGLDLIVIYNSGRYRMAGRGSAAGLLAFGNANEIVKEMAREVLPVVKRTPVLAGVNGTDPFVLMPQFLAELKAMGFAGVQNFPTVGLFDGVMRASFEETGLGFGLEVDMIAMAHELDLLTTPYVFNPGEAEAMAAGRGRRDRGAYGGDHRRLDRRLIGQVAQAMRGGNRRHRRGGDAGASGYHRPVSRRPDRHARRRAGDDSSLPPLSRLLWRQQHGAAPRRNRPDRTGAKVQGYKVLARTDVRRRIGAKRGSPPRPPTPRGGAYAPQRSAGVWTGASHSFSASSSSRDTVIEAPAMSSEVT